MYFTPFRQQGNRGNKFYLKLAAAGLAAAVLIPHNASAEEKDQDVIIIYKNKDGKDKIKEESSEIVHEFKSIPAISASLTDKDILQLKKDPDVVSIEKDVTLRITGEVTKEIPFEESQWGFQTVNPYAASFAEGIDGTGVKIAVVDSGIAPHAELTIAGGISTVDYTSSYTDDNGHGTHVAGIIGAKRNGAGMVGVAPGSLIYAVKTINASGEGNLQDLLEGLDWAIQNHMDIVNLSLGSPAGSPAMKSMIDKASDSGILVVASAGNDSGPVNYPAKYESSIAVSSIDQNKNLAPYSSRGPEVDVTAPGTGIASTYLNNKYALMSGTSQAAPHAAGILALVKQKNPAMTQPQLREELKKYTEDLGPAGVDSLYGYGLVNYAVYKEPAPQPPAPRTDEVVPGTGDGTENGTEAGPGSGTEAGPGSGTEAGAGSGTESGTEAGPGSGTENGTEAGNGSGTESGTEAGTGSGTENGTEAGTGSGTENGTEAGAGSGTESGTEAGTGSEPKNGKENGTGAEKPRGEAIADPFKKKAEAARLEMDKKLSNGKDALKALPLVNKEVQSARLTGGKIDAGLAAEALGKYQAIADEFYREKQYANAEAAIRDAARELTKKKADLDRTSDFVKSNIKTSKSMDIILKDLKKHNLVVPQLAAYRNEVKKAEIRKSKRGSAFVNILHSIRNRTN
ncbi:S8 family serine peptidase [Bacillus infantis]|uniref:S8 family serine peptidase n=1 Tax=Bacillus infantis TaxID=324767 RepID=UPI003CEB07EB